MRSFAQHVLHDLPPFFPPNAFLFHQDGRGRSTISCLYCCDVHEYGIPSLWHCIPRLVTQQVSPFPFASPSHPPPLPIFLSIGPPIPHFTSSLFLSIPYPKFIFFSLLTFERPDLPLVHCTSAAPDSKYCIGSPNMCMELLSYTFSIPICFCKEREGKRGGKICLVRGVAICRRQGSSRSICTWRSCAGMEICTVPVCTDTGYQWEKWAKNRTWVPAFDMRMCQEGESELEGGRGKPGGGTVGTRREGKWKL